MKNHKILSVNTDDFGLSSGVNRGILDAFRNGILTDASLMPNGCAYDEAVEMAREHQIPVAGHINLIRGEMLTGFDLPASVLQLWRRATGDAYLRKVEKEVREQIEKMIRSGLEICQLNSEKHAHFFPPLFKLWARLADEYGIAHIRFIREFNLKPGLQGIKANILSFFSLLNRKTLNRHRVRSTDHFTGILETGVLDENRLARLLTRLRTGWTELMVHVGYEGPIDPSMGTYFLSQSREIELKALINSEIQRIIGTSNITLRSFGGSHGE